MSACLQILAVVVIAAASLWLLYRYVQYGERSAQETGTKPSAETDTGKGTGFSAETDTGKETDLSAGTDADAKSEESAEKINTRGSRALPASIRVQILGDDSVAKFHDQVELTCDKDFLITFSDTELCTESEKAKKGAEPGKEEYRMTAGERFCIAASELIEGQTVRVSSGENAKITVNSLMRAEGHPKYSGVLLLYRETKGIVLVNEVDLEEYLCGVVSSEMPSDYPAEAQKAQAVCARTYACNCIRNVGSEKDLADLDDSVNNQVYNNYLSTPKSRDAVYSTAGEILPLAEIQYYSTSCQSEYRDDLDSDDAFRRFLSCEPDAGAEYDSPWLRWETIIPIQDIQKTLSVQYDWLTDRIDEIRVTHRSGSGQAEMMEVRCGDHVQTVEGEYSIRRLLSPESAMLRLMDGSEYSGMQLLPSAFFWLEAMRPRADAGWGTLESGMNAASETVTGETCAEIADEVPIGQVVIHGGGYGHGIGMSQCGAAALAEKGMDYREILNYYYQCEVSGSNDDKA